jgi:enoyl-CoA hydratase/carnithine racemase
MFLYPKPVVAAINGHAIAGGCMVAITCDHRIMVSEKAKISLNEIDLGVPVFSAITEILRFCVGSQNATKILYSGAMYASEAAHALGLVNEIVSPADLMDTAAKSASEFGRKSGPAFSGIKSLLRKPVLDGISQRENESIKTFVETWHSETARSILREVKIF